MSAVDVVLLSAGSADDRVAGSLQRAMERLARPWYRRRVLSVTRDHDGDGSGGGPLPAARWLVLLAGPETARSPRVGELIHQWVKAKGAANVLVVVTAGTWVWDQSTGQVDVAASSAAHPRLAEVFDEEPRHMDLSWARGVPLSARDPRLRESAAEIVAPVHGLTKDELVGEDVRQQARTMRRVRMTAASLAALTVVAVGAGTVAVSAAAEARRQEEHASEQRAVAEEQREVAEERRREADSRRLAAMSGRLQSQDGALARLLAVQAADLAPTAEAEDAVARAAQVADAWTTTGQTGARARLIGHETRPVAAAFAPDAARVATLDERSVLRVWTVSEPASPVQVTGVSGESVAFSRDGSLVAVPTGAQVLIYRPDGTRVGAVAAGGTVVAPYGDAGFVVAGPASVSLLDVGGVTATVTTDEVRLPGVPTFVGSSADGSVIVVADAAGEVRRLDPGLAVTSSWRFTVAEDQSGEADQHGVLALSEDGESVVLGPDNDTVRGPTMGPAGPDPGDNAVAGVYRSEDGTALRAVTDPTGYLPLPAPSAAFLPGGDEVLAVSPGGLESPPSLASTDPDLPLSGIPLPPRADLIAVSPDASLLLLAGEDGAATLLDMPGDEGGDPAASVRDRACRLAGRNLSLAEWQTYLPGRDYAAACAGFDSPYEPGARTVLAPAEAPSADGPGADPGDGPGADPGDGPGAASGLDGVDLANSTYDLACFMDEEQLVDGRASEAGFGTLVELVQEHREDMDGDGVTDAVLVFRCTGLAFVNEQVLVVDGGSSGSVTALGEVLIVDSVVAVDPGEVVSQSHGGAESSTWVLADGAWREVP
ncbi:hypothetical protein PU560_17505 [Georgenia sp. 10Sc9-8]|uniref:WD40 repeat domain-containing protein n=1 Tax=Georgenia halotolerans TaxID=3028317 RepID=A0ABT5U2U8_9MICO|nr:hypothetical protein [Georgenia halotolerans]